MHKEEASKRNEKGHLLTDSPFCSLILSIFVSNLGFMRERDGVKGKETNAKVTTLKKVGEEHWGERESIGGEALNWLLEKL